MRALSHSMHHTLALQCFKPVNHILEENQNGDNAALARILLYDCRVIFKHFSHFRPAALFLLDNRLEVYLWQRGPSEHMENLAPAQSCWLNERRCAMQTALQYCRGRRGWIDRNSSEIRRGLTDDFV